MVGVKQIAERSSLSGEERINLSLFSSVQGVNAFSDARLFSVERTVFRRHLRPPARVLDLGCGVGRTTTALAEMGFDVIGLDASSAMVTRARAALPDGTFAIGNACALAFRDHSFDVVLFSFNGLDYICPESKRLQALAEMRRVLRSGGLLVLSSHNRWGLISGRSGIGYYRWLVGFVRRNFLSAGARPSPAAAVGRYFIDHTAFGELTTYFIDPINQRRQLADSGFALIDVVGYFRTSLKYLEPWPYYVARRVDA
jgi:ubiquinone/menaquinone biosynthesis C-methylase UbiE